MSGEWGFCGFCGAGGGYLAEQGDDSTELLAAVVRVGDGPDTWEFHRHENALPNETYPSGTIMWCGECAAGLAHKFQRLNLRNLRAKLAAYRLWRKMDPVMWPGSEPETASKNPPGERDDPAVHIDKVFRDREIRQLAGEIKRRAGADITDLGWTTGDSQSADSK